MLGKIGMVLVGIAYFLGAIAMISGVGYTLYSWGSQGLDIGPSAWAGFVLFLQFVGSAIVFALVGVGTMYLDEL